MCWMIAKWFAETFTDEIQKASILFFSGPMSGSHLVGNAPLAKHHAPLNLLRLQESLWVACILGMSCMSWEDMSADQFPKCADLIYCKCGSPVDSLLNVWLLWTGLCIYCLIFIFISNTLFGIRLCCWRCPSGCPSGSGVKVLDVGHQTGPDFMFRI